MIRKFLLWWFNKVTSSRPPDEVIGGTEDPYLKRWCLLPKNRFLNVYFHLFLRSDDDRALHDHPFMWMAYLLEGCYYEHEILAGGVHKKTLRCGGEWRIRRPKFAHRIELMHSEDNAVKTFFIVGPKVRKWGFHCKDGWVHEDDYWKEGGC